jgi:dTDP-3-amino-3,4,6-trideoxy-alpha-D-glucose transaminase
MVHYPTTSHLQPACVGLILNEGDFPLTERMAIEVIGLPMGPHLTAFMCSNIIRTKHNARFA